MFDIYNFQPVHLLAVLVAAPLIILVAYPLVMAPRRIDLPEDAENEPRRLPPPEEEADPPPAVNDAVNDAHADAPEETPPPPPAEEPARNGEVIPLHHATPGMKPILRTLHGQLSDADARLRYVLGGVTDETWRREADQASKAGCRALEVVLWAHAAGLGPTDRRALEDAFTLVCTRIHALCDKIEEAKPKKRHLASVPTAAPPRRNPGATG